MHLKDVKDGIGKSKEFAEGNVPPPSSHAGVITRESVVAMSFAGCHKSLPAIPTLNGAPDNTSL